MTSEDARKIINHCNEIQARLESIKDFIRPVYFQARDTSEPEHRHLHILLDTVESGVSQIRANL